MRLPLRTVLRRGVVFLWTAYDRLDDPALASQTKPKYGIILSTSAFDDPILYILTTSEKPKHADLPFQQDLLRIPAGSYDFFPENTLVDVGQAGHLEVGRAEFETLYEGGAVIYKGMLTESDINTLVVMISACNRVSRRFKRMMDG